MAMVESHWLWWHMRAAIFAAMSSSVTGSMWSTTSASKRRSLSGRCGGPAVVAGGDDAVDDELAGAAVVGVEAVLLPRVVTEDDVGSGGADRHAHLLASVHVGFELAVDRVEEVHRLGAQRDGSGALLVVPGGDELGQVLVGGPGALRTVGEHEELHVRARAYPLGEGRAAAELDVVGVRADGEHAARGGVERAGGHDGCNAASDLPNAIRSSGTSTSNARSASRTTRSPRPSRRASAACRRNEPGP
jgi:hypothetical protein